MKPEDYMQKRLQDQIDWYDRKSVSCQKKFKILRWTEIVAAALITPLSCLAIQYGGLAYVVSLLGLVVVVATSFAALGKHHENWIEYRTTAETLLHEKFLYLTDTAPYDGGDKFNLLVQRCESIISKENRQWGQTAINKTER